jgi:uncharacterized membrane protein
MSRLGRAIRGLLLVVSLLGFLAAFYLTLVHYRGDIPRCYVVEGCAVVQTSKYSTILHVPIALLGTLYFALMFYLSIGVAATPGRRLILLYKTLAFVGALVAIPLFLIQAIVLHAYCTYCLVVELVLLVTWLASLGLAPQRRTTPDAPTDAPTDADSDSGPA